LEGEFLLNSPARRIDAGMSPRKPSFIQQGECAMRRVSLCVLTMAVVACLLPAAVLAATMTIEAEDANVLQDAGIRTGQSTASGGEDVNLQYPDWQKKGSAFFWLDAGSIAPDTYNLTVAIWAENPGRRVWSELRAGTHLAEDGNWLNPTGYAVPTSGRDAYDALVCTIGENWGAPTTYTFAPGQNYTLCVHAYGADMSYLDSITLKSVPEPTTLALMATGLLALLAYAWRKQR
jgi:hypothetical protein